MVLLQYQWFPKRRIDPLLATPIDDNRGACTRQSFCDGSTDTGGRVCDDRLAASKIDMHDDASSDVKAWIVGNNASGGNHPKRHYTKSGGE
jgi:hypothetical protein